MNTTWKFRLIQYFAQKDAQKGSIWIILIFGVIVLGGLFILAMPHLLVGGCGGKARQAEARNIIGAMNRAQQAYFFENHTLAKSISELQLGIRDQTDNYTYSIRADKNSTFHYAIARRKSVSNGWLDTRYLRSYIGAVFIDKNIKDASGEALIIAIACENNSPGTIYPSPPTFKNGVASCGVGTTNLAR